MSNFVRGFLIGAAVLASSPAFAQFTYQSGGSTVTSPVTASNTASITTALPGYTGTLDIGVLAGTPSTGTTTTGATTGGAAQGTGGFAINETNYANSFQKGPAAASWGVSTLVATQGTLPVAVDVVVGVARTTPLGSAAYTYAIGGGIAGSKTTIGK